MLAIGLNVTKMSVETGASSTDDDDVKAVNLVKKFFTVTEIMNFSYGIVFIGAPCIFW